MKIFMPSLLNFETIFIGILTIPMLAISEQKYFPYSESPARLPMVWNIFFNLFKLMNEVEMLHNQDKKDLVDLEGFLSNY